ncbi:hypothetical protein DFH06DRAFT_578375 [Mycena polygramma]|nr:hypothetical protein DFH06DRAFT_578375 [Mycena polygramma]
MEQDGLPLARVGHAIDPHDRQCDNSPPFTIVPFPILPLLRSRVAQTSMPTNPLPYQCGTPGCTRNREPRHREPRHREPRLREPRLRDPHHRDPRHRPNRRRRDPSQHLRHPGPRHRDPQQPDPRQLGPRHPRHPDQRQTQGLSNVVPRAARRGRRFHSFRRCISILHRPTQSPAKITILSLALLPRLSQEGPPMGLIMHDRHGHRCRGFDTFPNNYIYLHLLILRPSGQTWFLRPVP